MGSGVGWCHGEGVEGVSSGWRVLWEEGLEVWTRKRKSPWKSPKKIVDQRESEMNGVFCRVWEQGLGRGKGGSCMGLWRWREG